MRAPPITRASLWLLLLLWHGLILLFAFECAHSGLGWIHETPGKYWFEQILDGLSRGNLSPRAFLLLYFYAVVTVSAAVLAHALAQLLARIAAGRRIRETERRSVAALQPEASEPIFETSEAELSALLEARPELEVRLANFRSKMNKISGFSGEARIGQPRSP